MSSVQRVRTVLRWSSLALNAFCLWSISAYVASGNLYPTMTPFVVVFVLVTLACLAAWRWENAGGLAVIVLGVALGLASSYGIGAAAAEYGRSMPAQTIAGLVWAVPYIIFGLIFRALAQHARNQQPAYGF